MQEFMSRPRVQEALRVSKAQMQHLPGFPEPEACFVDVKGNVTYAWRRETVEEWGRRANWPVRWPGSPGPTSVQGASGRPSPDQLTNRPLWTI